MYRILLYGKLKEFTESGEVVIDKESGVMYSELKSMIADALITENRVEQEDIVKTLETSALASDERILKKDEELKPGSYSVIPPVSGGK